MKIIVRNIIAVILIVVMNVTVFASTNDLNKMVDGSTFTNAKLFRNKSDIQTKREYFRPSDNSYNR